MPHKILVIFLGPKKIELNESEIARNSNSLSSKNVDSDSLSPIFLDPGSRNSCGGILSCFTGSLILGDGPSQGVKKKRMDFVGPTQDFASDFSPALVQFFTSMRLRGLIWSLGSLHKYSLISP